MGEIFESYRCGKFEIIEDRGWDKVDVRFIDTGTIKTTARGIIKNGANITDPFAITVFGVACLGNSVPKNDPKIYRLWKNMLMRCYYPRELIRKPCYEDCSVSDEWLCFETFVKDIKEMDNYDLFLNGDYQLDKDLKVPGNRFYSKDTCSFVTPFVNQSAGRKGKTSKKGGKV